jgi:hypothetical protein
MQIEYHPLSLTGLGRYCVPRNSPREARRDGLNASLSSHGDADSGGLENEATPLEGAKRRYEAHFASKLTDCDGESNETDTALDFARDCGYITSIEFDALSVENRSVGRMLGSMIKDPSDFLFPGR